MIRLRLIPGQRLVLLATVAATAAAIALFAGVAHQLVVTASAVMTLTLLAFCVGDLLNTRRAWRQSQVRMVRRLPSAFAIGVRQSVHLAFESSGTRSLRCAVFDHFDPGLRIVGQPVRIELLPGNVSTSPMKPLPPQRGEIGVAPADLRVRSVFGLWEMLETVGENESRRCYPDFAQVARYAWLSGDRRLQEIGIKTYQQRGEGTDFKQLSEYHYGDPVRHIDWKATLRQNKPILREFQDERDQCVMLLIDCGRRMRAYDADEGIGGGHFDQVLNAVMLLSYVALKQGRRRGCAHLRHAGRRRTHFRAAQGRTRAECA